MGVFGSGEMVETTNNNAKRRYPKLPALSKYSRKNVGYEKSFNVGTKNAKANRKSIIMIEITYPNTLCFVFTRS